MDGVGRSVALVEEVKGHGSSKRVDENCTVFKPIGTSDSRQLAGEYVFGIKDN